MLLTLFRGSEGSFTEMANLRVCLLTLIFNLGTGTSQSAQIAWSNSGGDNEFSNPANWVGGAFPASETMVVDLTGANKAVASTGTTLSSDAIYIGYNGSDGEFEQTGGSLTSTSNSGAASRVGRNGKTGIWTMSGGRAVINTIQLGLNGGTGNLSITGGHLDISRGESGASLRVDHGGTGNFEISGGSLITRVGVVVGDQGTFGVIGHGASRIGIGSSGGLDGEWYQEAGGTLKVRVNATSKGVTPIFVDEVETADGTAGNVTFEAGAFLDVDFTGAFVNGGTYTVMEWEGTVTDLGLSFAPGVNTSVWSFNVDATNKKLTVTATGAPFIDTTVTVNSVAELMQYAGEDNFNVTMTPGTYWMTGPPESPAPVSGDQWKFLEFSGTNSTFDLTGVTIKVDTQELSYYGGVSVRVVDISGDGVVIDGLTFQMEKVTMNGVDAFGDPKEWTAGRSSVVFQLTGSNTEIKNCNITTGGSYPYGYGDAFGKGVRPQSGGVTNAAFIAHSKQSGFLITGGASNVTLDHVTLNMRSYGHGFFMQEGASDITFTNCDAIGDTMADSDDIIAHPEYQAWEAATYKVPIPADINISKHEGAFRVYSNSSHATNGFPEFIENITITNCRAERMRVGIACSDGIGFLRVTDTELVECEYGFAPSGLGTESTFIGCKGDSVNGPLIYFQRSVDFPATMEVELTGATPGKGVWPVALISGNGSTITLTSTASPGVYSAGAYVALSQKWREWRHRPAGDLDELSSGAYAEATTNTTVINQTDQPLFLGPNATGNNNLQSDGGVINKSTGNIYTGTTLVPANITIQDTWTSPTNPLTVPWAQFNGGTQILPTVPHEVFNGIHFVNNEEDVGSDTTYAGSSTEVQDGGTLELDGGERLNDGTVTLIGSGTTGQGAFFSHGQSGNGTRLGSTSASVTTLLGDTSIGVGTAGNQVLIGSIGGTGNLTKVGPGKLAMENTSNANTFVGSLTVAEGEIQTRRDKAVNDLFVLSGATFSQVQGLGLNQGADEATVIDGTLNLNKRGVSDPNAFSVHIGTLSGGASGLITSTSTAATQTVNVSSSTEDGTYAGLIQGTLALVKSGSSMLTLTGNLSYSEGTTINGGTLVVNGSLSSTGAVAINNGGTLGGSGTVGGAIALASGGGIAPGNSVGTFVTSDQTWFGGGALEVEMDDASGTAGSDWDLIDLNGTLTLDSSITSGTPFQIVLSGLATGFDNKQSYSWLVVDGDSIGGTFSASDFVVDSSDFEVTHSIAGGSFSVSASGGDLHLDFIPLPLTPLENWRVAYFGSEQNVGNGADAFDLDQDGRSNLIEYAVGSDPTVRDFDSVTLIGPSMDGPRLEISFNRIADPDLTYFVIGSTDLTLESWSMIWSSTGASNMVGGVTVPDTVLIADDQRRFLRLGVSY